MSDYLRHRQNQKMFGKVPEPKKVYSIPKKSAKKIAEEKEQKESGTDNTMDKWFEERRKEMTGKCAECGGKTGKDDDKFYRHSICHLLPKRPNMFPSVATNELNWIELCFWGNSCHSKFDSSFERASQMRIWPYVCKQINILYPFLTKEEKSRLPEAIIQEIKPDIYNGK